MTHLELKFGSLQVSFKKFLLSFSLKVQQQKHLSSQHVACVLCNDFGRRVLSVIMSGGTSQMIP